MLLIGTGPAAEELIQYLGEVDNMTTANEGTVASSAVLLIPSKLVMFNVMHNANEC